MDISRCWIVALGGHKRDVMFAHAYGSMEVWQNRIVACFLMLRRYIWCRIIALSRAVRRYCNFMV